MTIGIDASSAAKPVRTGVEQYAFRLIQALKKLPLAPRTPGMGDGPEQAAEAVRLYSPLPLAGDLAVLPEGWSSKILHWRFAQGWMRLRVGWEMIWHKPDVLFVPSQSLPAFAPRSRRRATATTVHDVGFLRLPNVYDPKDRKRQEKSLFRSIRKAKVIFAVSEFSKKELMETCRVPAERIVVTPLSADPAVHHPHTPDEITSVCDASRISSKYFLVIGRIDKKKNPLSAIQAFELFKGRRGIGDPFELVFAGPPGFGFDEVKRTIDAHPLHEQIHLLPYMSDDDVAALMSGAAAVIAPSFYEGFGLPNLEALACGASVIASDIPAHREVLDDAALFAPPGEPERFAEHMRRVADDPPFVADLRAAGLARAAAFSWDKTAALTLEALRDVV